jgi:hypothetical protein
MYGESTTLCLTTNSVVLVRERTIPTERPRLSAKLVPTFADRGGVAWSVRRIQSIIRIFLYIGRAGFHRLRRNIEERM